MDMRHSTPEEVDRFRADVSARELASERDERLWRRFTQVAIIIIALVVLAGALVAARAILIPIVAAVIIGSVIGPAIEAMGRRGIPTLLGSFLIVALLCALFYGIAAALAAPLADWINRAPEIGKLMQERFDALRPALRTITSFIDSIESIGRPSKPPLQVDVADSTMLQSMVSVVTPAIGEFILFFGSLLFFLAGRVQIKRKVVQVMAPRPTRLAALRVFRAIESRLGAYLVTATFINLGLGVATGLMTWVLGLPNPLLWGALACALNYIPYVGPAIMTAILAVVGVITFPTVLQGLLPMAVFLVFTTMEGHFLMPMIVGRRVSLNAFGVFLSMAVWTWLWGPIGTFLAVPLLITGQVLAEEILLNRRPHLPG
ncbi:MAG: family transporter [Microvirga sp.]|jgi:predicted PurR-regulated permease PerM|nr:family transporter [Microvirga sp.]